MADKIPIGVRYCGGCNNRYDRVAVIRRLETLVPDVEFVTVQPGTPYPAALVLAGCPADCAKRDDISVPAGRLFKIGGWEDLLPARDFIKKACSEACAKQEIRSLTHEQVLEILPQRPPMLFIDTVSTLVPGKEVKASFYVTPELSLLKGHFPDNPVFPGVCAVEAIAQAADILLLTLDRYAGKTPLFMGIKQAHFRKKILLSDTLEIYSTLLEERAELGWVSCRGQIFSGGDLAADAEITLAMR